MSSITSLKAEKFMEVSLLDIHNLDIEVYPRTKEFPTNTPKTRHKTNTAWLLMSFMSKLWYLHLVAMDYTFYVNSSITKVETQ